MSQHHFNDERNTPVQIGAVVYLFKFKYLSPQDLFKYLSPQENKVYIAVSDFMESNHLNTRAVSPAIAQEVFAKMSTRTYRVQVAGNGRVSVSSWGLAKDVKDTYDSVDALPDWMQLKIATLMIFNPEQVNEEVKGLGRRISKGTFWLYPDEGEDDGDDPRTPREDAGA